MAGGRQTTAMPCSPSSCWPCGSTTALGRGAPILPGSPNRAPCIQTEETRKGREPGGHKKRTPGYADRRDIQDIRDQRLGPEADRAKHPSLTTSGVTRIAGII